LEVQGLGNEGRWGDMGTPRYPIKLNIMKNKELFVKKLDHVLGKVQTIRVMATRQGTTVQDVHALCEQIEDQISDLNTMLEREQ